MKRLTILSGLLALLLVAGPVVAQDSTAVDSNNQGKSDRKVVTGFSGGVMVHLGYAFTSSPDELFRNGSLKEVSNVSDLPSDGVTLGVGAMLRMHFLDCIHLGIEGNISTMPLMKSGSNIRTGWGDVFCDFYFPTKLVRPLLGLGVGGGSMKRLYVPSNAEQISGGSTAVYNASYTTSPFFLLDPYIGLEFGLGSSASIIIRADYMLPFGKSGSTLAAKDITWSNFITPSGPRLYVGIMLGKN